MTESNFYKLKSPPDKVLVKVVPGAEILIDGATRHSGELLRLNDRHARRLAAEGKVVSV